MIHYNWLGVGHVEKLVCPPTCLVCLDEPVLLLREWLGLNVLAGDLSMLLITDWLLLSGGGGHTWGSIGSMCCGKLCMEFVMESEVVVGHGRGNSTEGENKASTQLNRNLPYVYRYANRVAAFYIGQKSFYFFIFNSPDFNFLEFFCFPKKVYVALGM